MSPGLLVRMFCDVVSIFPVSTRSHFLPGVLRDPRNATRKSEPSNLGSLEPSLLSHLLFLVSQTDPNPVTPPRLGKLWVTDPTPDSLHLSWTVPEGQFDSFVVQYRDRDGRPQVVPVEGPERSIIISPLDPDHKYRFTLFGIANKKRHGPLTADGTTGEWQPPKPPALQGG